MSNFERSLRQATAIREILAQSGIETTGVTVIGRFTHVDTEKAASNKLISLMLAAKFKFVNSNNGKHIDGTKGHRVTFKTDFKEL